MMFSYTIDELKLYDPNEGRVSIDDTIYMNELQ